MGGTANAKRQRARRSQASNNATIKSRERMSRLSKLLTPPPKKRTANPPIADEDENGVNIRHTRTPTSENILAFGGRSIVSPFIDGDLFEQEVQVRPRRERNPMNPVERLKTRAANMRLRRLISNEQAMQTDPNAQKDSGDKVLSITSRRKQFTVTTSRKANTLIGKLLCHSNPDDFSYAPSGAMVKYINWTFKSSFAIVFLSFVIIFLLLVFIFGIFFKYAGEAKPECIIVAGKSFDYYGRGTTLMDGFGLSWTTFTTVGYGSTYIATGNELENLNRCVLITLLSTAESFIGLLYAGICTAIMFGKIGRIQSHAQVTFSDAVCVEYGREKAPEDDYSTKMLRSNSNSGTSGRRVEFEDIAEEGDDDDLSEDDESGSEEGDNVAKPQSGITAKKKQIMCPVIKFQLINQLCNEGGGEILDANMNVMVRKEKESYPFEPIARFLRVALEEPSHPFFNRVWHGRHVLDENSPLVSIEVRNKIKLNGGFWPEEFNNPTSVRAHLRFSSLIITMTGISNVSAESVQISKRYYHHDILVGYAFAPLLFVQEGSEMLKVDMSLANDVVEQSFSPGEKLTDHEKLLPSLREKDTKNFAYNSRPNSGTLSSSVDLSVS